MRRNKETISIFVIMPFGNKGEYNEGNDEAEHVYNMIIRKGVSEAFDSDLSKVEVQREFDKNKPGSITKAILNSLATADIVIADLTGHNSNVFLELGIRLSLRNQGTIIMTQDAASLPFDIRNFRCIPYRKFNSELSIKKLASFIKESLSENQDSDSIVFDAFPSLSVKIPMLLESYGPKSPEEFKERMSWEDFESRINAIIDAIEGEISDGRFTPHAILGISNGGYIVADLIGRRLFKGKPVLGLWAHRYEHHGIKNRFFNNEYNKYLCKSILEKSKLGQSNEPIRLILVDDHYGHGSTASQAIGYLKERLGNDTRILFIPVVTGRTMALEAVEEYLPYHYEEDGIKIFPISKKAFLEIVSTHETQFPYMKKQISHE